MSKKPSIAGFIFSLVILTGIVWFLVWVNTDHNTYDAQQITDNKKECKGGPAGIAHGDTTSWNVSRDDLKEDELVTFEGYIKMPNMTYLNGGTYLVSLCRNSLLEGGITLMIWEGDCENTMAPIPSDYEHSDLLIYDNNSKKIHHGDKVKVTGKVRDDGGLFTVFVKRIEKSEG